MERPSSSLAQQIQEVCPQCRSQTLPVIVDDSSSPLLTAAYRCVMCRYDFTSVWQQGYVRQNQPELPFGAQAPITSDLGLQQSSVTPPVTPSTAPRAPDDVCSSCLAQPGTPHALACPYA